MEIFVLFWWWNACSYWGNCFCVEGPKLWIFFYKCSPEHIYLSTNQVFRIKFVCSKEEILNLNCFLSSLELSSSTSIPFQLKLKQRQKKATFSLPDLPFTHLDRLSLFVYFLSLGAGCWSKNQRCTTRWLMVYYSSTNCHFCHLICTR